MGDFLNFPLTIFILANMQMRLTCDERQNLVCRKHMQDDGKGKAWQMTGFCTIKIHDQKI